MARPTDQSAIDRIANVLAEPEWNVEYLETIADIIGDVRPHPGGHDTREEYATKFWAATRRDVITFDDPDDVTIGGH